MSAQYDWELTRYGAGILTRLEDGWNVCLQGDDAYDFDEQWEACETDEQCNMLASAYDDVLGPDLDTVCARARELGKETGENAARWAIQELWGGRATRCEQEAARNFLRMFDDGDPALAFSPPNLSGEYADSDTPQTLACELGIADYPDIIDDACSAWEEGCDEGYWDTLCESAHAVLSTD